MEGAASLDTNSDNAIVKFRTYKRKGLLILTITVTLIIFLGLGTFLFFVSRKDNSLQQTTTSKEVLFPYKFKERKVNSNKRIYFYRNKQMYSVTLDGKNEINLTKLLNISEKSPDSGNWIFNANHTGIYYVRNQDIWYINTDGSNRKIVVRNPYPSRDYWVTLYGVTDDERLIFAYEVPQGMGDIRPDPYVKHGIYVYDPVVKSSKFLRQNTYEYEYITTVGNKPIYSHKYTYYLYVLDLVNGQFLLFSHVELPTSIMRWHTFIDEENRFIVSIFGDIPTSYSQVLAINYESGEKITISPAGKWADFQSLSVSPSLIHVIYSKEIRKEFNENNFSYNKAIKTDYYLFNLNTLKTQKLPIYPLTITWIDDYTLLYKKDNAYYKYDITTQRIGEKLVDNID